MSSFSSVKVPVVQPARTGRERVVLVLALALLSPLKYNPPAARIRRAQSPAESAPARTRRDRRRRRLLTRGRRARRSRSTRAASATRRRRRRSLKARPSRERDGAPEVGIASSSRGHQARARRACPCRLHPRPQDALHRGEVGEDTGMPRTPPRAPSPTHRLVAMVERALDVATRRSPPARLPRRRSSPCSAITRRRSEYRGAPLDDARFDRSTFSTSTAATAAAEQCDASLAASSASAVCVRARAFASWSFSRHASRTGWASHAQRGARRSRRRR